MKPSHIVMEIPTDVNVFPVDVSFTQSELNFMLDGTRRSIQDAYTLRKQIRKVCSQLWPTCDKADESTKANYSEYIHWRTVLKRLNKDIKRLESISRKIKVQRQMVL